MAATDNKKRLTMIEVRLIKSSKLKEHNTMYQ